MPDVRPASLSLQTLGSTGVLCLSALVLAQGSLRADVSVQQSTDKKLGKAVFTVSNGMYRVEWVQGKGATPTIARAWAGDDVPVGRLFQVSWGQVIGGNFNIVERGPVRAVLLGQFRVKQAGSAAIDIVRIRAEHWDNDPRIVVTCDFELGKKHTRWVLCSNYLRIGGEANHPDRWVASGKPDGGLLDPLTSAPVPDGKRWAFFDFMTPWGEVYRPEPQEKSAGVGAFTDAHGMRGEHFWHPKTRIFSPHRWLWSYFRMNSAFKGKYRQAFTLVVHPGTEEPETRQPWTGYCYDRFAADGSLKGIWMSPLQWQKRKLLGKRLPWSQVEIIEDLGLPRSNVPLVIPLLADLPGRERAQVWLGGLPESNDVGASALPTQWNGSRSSLLCQLPYLGASELVTAHVLIPTEGAEAPVIQKAASSDAVDRFTWRIDLPVHRLNYLRGEVLPLKLTATPDGKSLTGAVGRVAVIADPYPSEAKWAAPVIGTDPAMSFLLTIGPLTKGTGAKLRLPTRDLAAGEYRLLAEVQICLGGPEKWAASVGTGYRADAGE